MKRTRQKNIRLTSEEEKLLRKKCFDLGITESEFFRSLVNDYMPNTNLNKEINKLTYEIRKIGININQIAKVSNQTGNVNYIYLEHYKKELDKKTQYQKNIELYDMPKDIKNIRESSQFSYFYQLLLTFIFLFHTIICIEEIP